MDQENIEEEEFMVDLTNLQQLLIGNIHYIRKNMASNFNPFLLAIFVIVVIGTGLFLSIENNIINALSLIILFLIGGFLLVLRHLLYVRSVNNALEYVEQKEPLKNVIEVPFINRFIVFSSPADVYDTAVSMLENEWRDLVPIFEANLQSVNELHDNEPENNDE